MVFRKGLCLLALFAAMLSGAPQLAAQMAGQMPGQPQAPGAQPRAPVSQPQAPLTQARPQAPLTQAAPMANAAQAPTGAPAAPTPGGVQGGTGATGSAQTVSLADGYVIGVGDMIAVGVIGRPEYQAQVQVQTDGTIQLPFINSIEARDKTVLQLRDFVRKRLVAGGYYSDPAVNVQIVNYASRYVTVLGEVGSPGILPIDRSYRISEILARVGGARTGSDQVTVTRDNGVSANLSISEVATGAAMDVIVNPGDKIYVAPPKTFYIYGQINGPGNYPIDRNMTLQKAIARAGGLNALGSMKRIKVTRDGREIKKFKLSEPIKDGDVIVIGERFF